MGKNIESSNRSRKTELAPDEGRWNFVKLKNISAFWRKPHNQKKESDRGDRGDCGNVLGYIRARIARAYTIFARMRARATCIISEISEISSKIALYDVGRGAGKVTPGFIRQEWKKMGPG